MIPLTIYQSLFSHSPIAGLLLMPTSEAIILDVNDALLSLVSSKRADLIGKSLFEIFPGKVGSDGGNNSEEILRRSIAKAIATRKNQFLPAQLYPLGTTSQTGEEVCEKRFWNACNAPILDETGKVVCIYHFTAEVTNAVLAEAEVKKSEERFRSLVTATSQIVWIAEPSGEVFEESPSWHLFTGQTPEEGKGRGWLNALHPDDREPVIRSWMRAVKDRATFETEYRLRRHDGEYRWMAVRATPILNNDGTAREWIGTNTDIEDKKRAEEELRIANQRLKLAIEGAGEGVWEWDVARHKITYTLMFKEIAGCLDQGLAEHPHRWQSLVHPHDLQRMDRAMEDYVQGKTPSYSCEYRIRCKDGSWRWIHSRGVLVEKAADGKPLRVAGMINDITERKEADERIWHLANFDTLTSLPNRRLFRDRLAHAVIEAQRRQWRAALLFIDLDGFKQVNDLYGHDSGDALLFDAAHRIQQCVRQSDTVARLGGDEFTIILSDLHGREHIEQIAQNVLDALNQPFLIGGEKAFVSGSVGIAVYPDDAGSPEELIRKADQAMYAAKSAGKNQFSYFTREMDEKAHLRLRLIQELRKALQSGQVKVHYQPVVELQSGRVIKAEALARWTHPQFGNVEPSLFIPLAEESGMINAIGDFVFKEAAFRLKRWNALVAIPLQVSVNKSPIQFSSKEQDSWLGHLRQLGLPPDCVTVEVTEGVLLDMSENVSSKLLEYRDAGIQVAIDDFGTGYSSLAYLQKFDIDFLKIDKSFIQDLPSNQDNRSIAESIIAMAHKLGLKVIAEGVESQEQMEILRQAGCDFGQGYYFSQPLSARDFETMLITENTRQIAHALH